MAGNEDSLISDDMRAQIGKRSDASSAEVDKTSIRLFARSVGHTDPIYYDEDAAKAAGYRNLPAPPGYLGTPIFNPSRAAGRGVNPLAMQTPRPLTRILNGGTEIEYLGDICAGDVLTSESYIDNLAERTGGIGQMLIVTSKTEYKNQEGEVVAVSTGTLIRY
jgi:acyl dehydratase